MIVTAHDGGRPRGIRLEEQAAQALDDIIKDYGRVGDLMNGWEYQLARNPNWGMVLEADDREYRLLRTDDWGVPIGFHPILILYTFDDEYVTVHGLRLAHVEKDPE